MNAQDREWLGRIESKLDTNTAETAELKSEIHTLSVKAFGNVTRGSAACRSTSWRTL